MQDILPLKYKAKIWNYKNCNEDTLEKYIEPNYIKNKLEEIFAIKWRKSKDYTYIMNIWDRVVWLDEDIIVENWWTFIKFRYWKKILEDDNWKITSLNQEEDWNIKETKIIMTLPDEWIHTTDFFCAIRLNFSDLKEESKWFNIEWDVIVVKKWNEIMTTKIKKILEKKIFNQNDEDHKSEHYLDFLLSEKEIKDIEKDIKWLELIWEYHNENKLEAIEEWKKEKKLNIQIIINQNNIWFLNSIKNRLKDLFPDMKQRAKLNINGRNYTSDYQDNLKLSLKKVFLYSSENISFETFKKEVENFQ